MSSQRRTRDELIRSVIDSGRRMGTASVFLHEAVADCLGLNSTDHKCLGILVDEGPMTAGQLAEHTGLTTGAITGVIDRLERAGYASRDRDPDDRRRVIVRPILTPELARLMERIFAPLARSMAELAASYDDEKLEFWVEFMNRGIAILHENTVRVRDDVPAASSAADHTH